MNFPILLDAGLPFGPAAAAGLEHHPPKPRLLFKMPRVVANQKEKFETDDLMKRHSREGEVSQSVSQSVSQRKKAAVPQAPTTVPPLIRRCLRISYQILDGDAEYSLTRMG